MAPAAELLKLPFGCEDLRIRQIEHFPSKLKILRFSESEVFLDREIEYVRVGPAKNVAARIAELSRGLDLKRV